jgi:hypothetical protein
MSMVSVPPPDAGEVPRRKGERLNAVMEWIGYALLVGFAAAWGVRWALLAAAVVLVVTANLRDAAARPARPAKTHWTDRAARALAVWRGSQ